MHILDLATKWNATIIALANIVIAAGTLVLAFGIPWSLLHAAREERDTFYSTLDSTYFEIQKLIIERPHLSRPALEGKTADEVIQYNAFAFMTWNFIEAIYDYSKDDEVLRDTWHCVLRYEAAIHGAWFNKPENRTKFKPSFVNYIRDEKCIPGECSPGELPQGGQQPR